MVVHVVSPVSSATGSGRESSGREQHSAGCGAPAAGASCSRDSGAQAHRVVQQEALMELNIVTITPLVALVAGVLILIAPRILNYVIAIYLILVGVTGLWPHVFR
jgi:hypothetical protein